ncbi:hypothetical protein FF38_09351 [Lucilia cuprina]|uniref:Uncharacterized protein n=1 Tax=Lucilia cuprina TaxID=7375 RepID=A0A0L0CT28_LUCCU|nr:hypothetical protein FF38_09351 [Lucilia cuprina]
MATLLPKLMVHKSLSRHNCLGMGRFFSNTSKFHLSQVATLSAKTFKANCLRVKRKPSILTGIPVTTGGLGTGIALGSALVKSNCGITTLSGAMEMNCDRSSKAEGSGEILNIYELFVILLTTEIAKTNLYPFHICITTGFHSKIVIAQKTHQ